MTGDAGRHPFTEAMEAPVPPLHLDVEDEALRHLAAVVDAAGVVLVGETHGVAENAAVLAWLVRSLGVTQVGLEWRSRPAEALLRFAQGGQVELQELKPSADGRITPQLFAAARQLRQDGLDVDFVAFAPDLFAVPADDPSQNSWERVLGERLLTLRDNRRAMVALTGSVHAAVDAQPIRGPAATPTGRIFANHPAFADIDVFYPMGWHVAQALPTAAVRIRYGGGTYSNLGLKSFARDPAIRHGALRLQDGQIIIDLPMGTAALVPGD